MQSINPLAKTLTCIRGEVSDPLMLVGSCKGEGATKLGFLDEHRNLLKAAEQESLAHENHDHAHESKVSCAVPNCTDNTHSHDHDHRSSSAVTAPDSCSDPQCASHEHSHEHRHEHSHEHSHNHDSSCDATCNDPTHNHDHSHSHSHNGANYDATTAETRFGITSFVYKRRVPFHPVRFSRFLQSIGRVSIKGMSGLTLSEEDASGSLSGRAAMSADPALMNAKRALMRSKGFVWMATSKAAAYFMSHAGQYLELQVLGRWWADIPKGEWPAGLDADIATDFDGSHGDRRQELVFIGQFGKQGGQSKEALEGALDACLLTPEEMKDYEKLSSKGDNALQDHFSP